MVNGWFTRTVGFAWISHPFWRLFYRLYHLTPLLCTVLFLISCRLRGAARFDRAPFAAALRSLKWQHLTLTSSARTAAEPPGSTQARAAARSATPSIALAAQVAISGAGRGGSGTSPAFCWRPARWKRAGSKQRPTALPWTSVSPERESNPAVNRLLDSSARDARGVSALQQPHNIWTERGDAPG
jgi:hypothetical protein